MEVDPRDADPDFATPETKTDLDDPKLIAVLERIADSLERLVEIDGRASALAAWQMGQGRHPDD